ncbi:hypothetical protein MKX03_011791 [Papaver bracteatum]|nr:hypothetical protein MKX03_011791 [Papaver bracteatum]
MSSFTEGLNLRQGSSWQRKSADYSKRFKIKMDVAATDFCIEITSDVLVLKVNQIGTDAEAIKAVKLSKNANWGIVTTSEADLAVGVSTS